MLAQPQLVGPVPDRFALLPARTQEGRERIEEHTGFGTCGEGRHGGYINPLGFAFENFDGLGRFRDVDKGHPVDTASAYPSGDQGMVEFTGAPELMSIMAESTEAHSCFAKNLMGYALQRDIVESDLALIDQLTAVSTLTPDRSKKSCELW